MQSIAFVRTRTTATLRTRVGRLVRSVSGLYRGAPRYPLSGWKARLKQKVGDELPYSITPNIANTTQTITAIKGRPIQINNQIAISHKITFTTKGIEFLFSMHKDNKIIYYL